MRRAAGKGSEVVWRTEGNMRGEGCKEAVRGDVLAHLAFVADIVYCAYRVLHLVYLIVWS